MKKIYYKHIAIILLVLTGLSSCVDNTFTASTEKEVSADFSLDEAKCYYQRQAKSCGIMADNINKITLSPGEIVPQWNSAVFSMQGNVACYDIPINGSYSYQAIRSQKRNGILTAEKSGVYQRLIILKNLDNKQLSHYILSLIPDKSCEQQCKQDAISIFSTRGNKSRFSGMVMYSCLYESHIMEVDLYSLGKKTSGVSLFNIKGYNDYKNRIHKLKDVLSHISFQKKKRLLTRGEYDIDAGWLDEVVITPDEPWDGTGADGMTNEEWLDSTRPDDYVDSQPEPEPDTNDWENEYISESKNDEQYYIELGNEGIQKITTDLENGNVKIQQVKMSAGEAILNGTGIGLNANGLITSCINFMENAQKSALNFGTAVSGTGLVIGISQTWIGYSDGDITTQDKLNLISTALNAAGMICVLVPGGQMVSGVLGVASCVIGLVSTFVTSETQQEIHLQFADGTSFHMYLIS